MKRALATLLLALFSFSLIGPALSAASPHDNLPACCLRSGKHHCAGTGAQSESSGASLKGATCSSWPTPVAATAPRLAGFATGSPIRGAGLVALPVDLPQRTLVTPTPHNRTDHQRGPPTLV